MKKKIIWGSLIAILVTLLAIQRVEVAPNNSGIDSLDVMKGFPTSHRVKTLLQTACYDCHSNTTTYPWYAKYQPVGMWLESHVEDGKKHLNFNEFLGYRPWRQFHTMEETVEMVEEEEMPTESYTWMYEGAKLEREDRESLVLWAKGVMDSLTHLYPKDSLVNPRSKK